MPISILNTLQSSLSFFSDGADNCWQSAASMRAASTLFVPEDWIPVARAMRWSCATFSGASQANCGYKARDARRIAVRRIALAFLSFFFFFFFGLEPEQELVEGDARSCLLDAVECFAFALSGLSGALRLRLKFHGELIEILCFGHDEMK